jgi:hypothetical protein
MLFACAAETLLDLGRDPDRLNAQLAVTGVSALTRMGPRFLRSIPPEGSVA